MRSPKRSQKLPKYRLTTWCINAKYHTVGSTQFTEGADMGLRIAHIMSKRCKYNITRSSVMVLYHWRVYIYDEKNPKVDGLGSNWRQPGNQTYGSHKKSVKTYTHNDQYYQKYLTQRTGINNPAYTKKGKR